MAGSPGTAALPDNAIMGSPPPSSPSPNAPPLQGNPSLPADAPPEPSPPDHATPIPPPSPGRATEGRTEADELLTSPPLRIDGTPGAAGPPPSFSSLEAAALGRPSSRSLLPPTEAVEFYSEAASSPSSSYETADDASPASPPPTPPPLVLCASPDSYFTEPAEMASPEREPMDADEGSTAPEPPTPPLESGPGASSTVPAAMASPARDPMGADEGSHTAPEPPTPPLESGPEGFEQQPHPPPTTPPECDSSGPVELPFPPTSPVEIAHTLPDAAEIDAVAGTSEKAPGSTTAMEVTDATEIDAVAGTPEKAPGSTAAMEVTDATEIDKVTRKPEQAPDSTAAMEVTDATEIDAVAGTPEEAPGSTVAMEVTYGETGTAAVSVSPVLESREEGSLQESTEKPSSPTMNTETVSMQRPSSPTMDTEPCLPEMAPLGFQQQQQQPHPPPTTPPECDSSEPAELPLPPTSLADIAHTLPDAAEVNVVAVMPEVAPGSTVVMEVTYREIDTTAVSVLPVLESREEGSLEESTEKPSSPTMNTETVSMRRPSSPTMDTEPCLTEMAPLGFQQQQQKPHPPPTTPPECVSSEPVELPLPPTSLADIAHTLPDAAEVNVVAVMPEEAPGSTVVMEVTYREIDTTAVSVPPVLESGEEGSLQESMQRPSFPAVNTEPESMQRPSSPTMDTEPCLPEMATLEFQQQQQQPHPPPTASPECDSLRHVELPLPPTSLAEIAHTLPDAAEIDVVAGTPEEAPGSTLAMTVTYRETDTTAVSVPLVVECGKEGSLQESMQRPSSPIMVTESCSREMEPPGFENCKASWLPVPPSTPPGESISSLPVAGASKGLVVMPEEAVDSVPSSEALDAEKPPTSPDMPPPGFENFKSSWLQLPTTPPVETTDVLPDVVVTKAVEAPIEEVSGPLPALEVTNMETDTVLNILPTEVLPTEGTEWLLQQPPLKPPSPVGRSEPCSQDEMAPPGFENFKSSSEPCSAEEMPPPGFDNFKSSSEPCSPEEMAPPGFENLKSSSEQCLPEEMAPPGFENFKSSWPPLPSLPQTAYALPDGAATDALAVTVEEAAGPPPAIEAMNVDMDAIHPPPLPFDSGVEGSLQEPPPRVSSPIMQEASCSPDRAPPGFETYKSSQLLLPSPTLAQTTNVRQDQLVTEAVSVIEEAPQPLHSVEVMSANMDTAPPLLLLSESGPDGPFPRQLPCLPPAEKGTTTCLPDMAHSGCDDLEPSQLLPPPAVISPVQTPDGLADVPAVDRIAVASEESPHRLLVSGGMEDGTVPIQSSPLENASEGSLPQVESQVHSPTAQAVDSLLDAPGSKSVAVTSEEMSQPPLASQATNTDLVSTTTMQPQSEGIVDESLQPQHPPSSIAHAAPCLQDSVSLVPQPPSPFLNKDIGQMVCGSCRVLLAYFRGAGHVHCTCCQTMNLVLEASYLCMVVCPPIFVAAHEVGNVHCGRCETLLMYPFGAPAVKCSRCLFVTEIGERNVRPRLSKPDQAVPPHQTELAHQG